MAIQRYEGKLGKFEYDDTEFQYHTSEGTPEALHFEFFHYIGSETDGSKIKIPDGMINCNKLFESNVHLETPPKIPEGVKNCDLMFHNCYSLKQFPEIPDSVQSYLGMFQHTPVHEEFLKFVKAREEKSMASNNRQLKATPSGGDMNSKEPNMFMFYVDNYGGYPQNKPDSIALYGKENIPFLKDKSIDEIKNAHMYWGSDEARSREVLGMYNGDTMVLFGDIEKLPTEYKHDAELMTPKYVAERVQQSKMMNVYAPDDLSKNSFYLITLGSKDEDGEVFPGVERFNPDYEGESVDDITNHLCDLFSQTDKAYVDNQKWVHEVYEGKDQVFGKYVNDISDKTMNKIYEEIKGYGKASEIPTIKSQIVDLRKSQRTNRRLPDIPDAQTDNEKQCGE